MGLLDFEDPQTAGIMKLGLGLLSAGGPSRMPISVGQGIGQAGSAAMDEMQQARQMQVQNQLRNLQMQELARKTKQAQMADAAKQKILSDPATDPRLRKYVEMGGDLSKLFDPTSMVEGAKMTIPGLAMMGGNPVIAEGAPKHIKPMIEHNFAVGKDMVQPHISRDEGVTWNPLPGSVASNKHQAPSITNVTPKIEVKMGESVVGQIGPMLKDSKIAALGAVKMNDSADRILKAIDTNQVSSGPLTSAVMTVKQFLNPSGGKETENIRQTRQVIRALAESSVEARKELQGQGQVTENEALAVQKAMSGDIDSLTIGELRDIANLNKKAATFRARSHKQMLDSLSGDDTTKKYVPYYQVPDMDKLVPKKIRSDADYKALPSGATFIDPQGNERRKP